MLLLHHQSIIAHVHVGDADNFLIDDYTEYSPLHIITAAAGIIVYM